MSPTQVIALLLGEDYEDQWKPTPRDIAWTKQHVERFNDGGYWLTSEGIFKIDKANKVLLYAGPKRQIFHRVQKCAPHFGWTVRHVSENPDEKSFSA